MEFITKLADKIQYLSKKDFQKYLVIFLVSIGLVMVAMAYYIYTQNDDLIMRIKKLEKLGYISVNRGKRKKEKSNLYYLIQKPP